MHVQKIIKKPFPSIPGTKRPSGRGAYNSSTISLLISVLQSSIDSCGTG